MKWNKKDELTTVKDVFMRNIGVTSLDEINGWFKKSYASEYRIDRIDEAVKMLNSHKNETITIVGDYDADGITSTSILVLALTWAGFADVRYRIPKRFSEGFGISDKIIDEIESGLVITVDNGVAQPDAIKKAKDKGLAVIVTDHHQPLVADGKVILPEADIIIDPNAIPGSADFNGYCGAGIAYKIAICLLGKEISAKLLPLAGIGTVADVMELRQENYVFVRRALSLITNATTTTPGLYALVSALNLTRHISAKDIGFKIGPCINAASRMNDDGAKEVVKLLTFTGAFTDAIPMAEALVATNEKRKEAKNIGIKTAENIIADECLFGDVPIVLNVPGVEHGIIGIIAGNLCEKYKVPVCVTSEIGGVLKGSARSPYGYNMKEALDECADLLIAFGGHEGAAGFSLKPEMFEDFKNRLQASEMATSFVPEDVNEGFYDLEVDAKDIDEVTKELEKYAPFGEGNPEIVFKVNGFSTIPSYGAYVKFMGDGSIVKLLSKSASAIGFGMSERFADTKRPMNLSLYGTVTDSYFSGSVEHQIEFADFVENESAKVKTSLASRLEAMALIS